jgi:hypothetical protein
MGAGGVAPCKGSTPGEQTDPGECRRAVLRNPAEGLLLVILAAIPTGGWADSRRVRELWWMQLSVSPRLGTLPVKLCASTLVRTTANRKTLDRKGGYPLSDPSKRGDRPSVGASSFARSNGLIFPQPRFIFGRQTMHREDARKEILNSRNRARPSRRRDSRKMP